jgi:hypothetical protein
VWSDEEFYAAEWGSYWMGRLLQHRWTTKECRVLVIFFLGFEMKKCTENCISARNARFGPLLVLKVLVQKCLKSKVMSNVLLEVVDICDACCMKSGCFGGAGELLRLS